MRLLDLFSGIGGFSLGLERAGFRTVAFCEIEPFQRAVLNKHWPEVPVYDDIRTLSARDLDADGVVVDAICGGFPCQDISLAGRGAGLDGDRSGLWFEYLRLIDEIRPQYAIVENVPALRNRGLDTVLRGLASIGYDAEWHLISAGAIGAPHIRERVWILAYPESQRRGSGLRGDCPAIGGQQPADCGATLANLGGSGLPGAEQPEWREPFITAAHVRRSASERRWGRPAPGVDGKIDGVPGWMDGARPVESWEGNTPRTVGKGYPNRRSRLISLGNSVVPSIPELIGRAVITADGDRL
jgi:DNA (cytosine-5)-methyltransferase 1